MTIKEEFEKIFSQYKEEHDKEALERVVTSTYRNGNPRANPHAVRDNAEDFTLRWRGDYAPISMYNHLMEYLMVNWPYRAGVDNTIGNIHIHIDLGKVKPEKQKLPFFFLEDDGKFQKQIYPEDLGGL